MGLKTSGGGGTQTWSCAGIWVYVWQLEVFIFLPWAVDLHQGGSRMTLL